MQRHGTVNVLGTIGYGKSFILATLAAVLLKHAGECAAPNGVVPIVCYNTLLIVRICWLANLHC